MNHFQRYLAEEFAEDYEEGRISRRKALKMIAQVTGSVVIAQTILAACAPPDSSTQAAGTIPVTGTEAEAGFPTTPASMTPVATTAADGSELAPTAGSTASPTRATHGTVPADDPTIVAGEVQFPGEDGAMLSAYRAYPQGSGPFDVILVCHENRGLTDHIRDVTRRVAKAGYASLAVDLLSRSGGTASMSSDEVPGVLGNTAPEQFVQDFRQGVTYLAGQEFANTTRLGMMGFCFGGGVTWQVATQLQELRAAVPFYGPPPPLEEIPNIQAAVLAIYGELDSRINSTIPEVEAAMQENGKIYEKVVYPGADHAFFNDTSTRYNAEAAQDAWERTLAWFERYVRST
jgi:carboxymethylenebutenolidase